MPDLSDDLAQLQRESLKLIALLAGVFGYGWLLRSMPPNYGVAAPPSAWVGTGLLILGAAISLLLKERRLRFATYLLVWAILGAAVCAMLTFPAPGTLYLFIMPVIFASVLLSPPAFLAVAATAILAILTVDLSRTGTPVLSGDRAFPFQPISLIVDSLSHNTGLPLTIIGLATLSSWLSTRSFYTALAWFWHAYERARHNERAARDHQAELKRTLKTLDEVTHRLERANYMLTLARDQAEEAQRLKQRFAQTISHELRTPLNLIVGFAELMTQSPEYYGGQLPTSYLRDLNIMHRNACHLQELVNDVLDLARIEAAQMGILPEETDPAILVEEAVNTARSLVEARGLALQTDIEPNLPRLWIDRTRIRQVLFNLLNNAARFTEWGNVTVSVCHQEGKVRFAVADTGVGIEPAEIPRIFDEFHQVDGSTRRQYEGAGLGLAISRRFVELHNGRIWVESQLGKGSTFYFSLPVRLANPTLFASNPSLDTNQQLSAASHEEPILLAVTRSLSAAALLTRYVHGFRTVVVPGLEQARHTVQQLMPQAIVLDKANEELDPVELEALVQTWGLPDTPFMICPLPGEEPLRQRLAVDGYLIKPVSRHSLWGMVRRFGEDVDKILVVDDDQDFVLMISRLLEDSRVRRYQVINAYSGYEGLTMIQHHRPDLVLLDLMLPDMDGTQVIERIRANAQWQNIPIVIISAQDEMDHQLILRGPIMITKKDGLKANEVVGWIQDVVNTQLRVRPDVQETSDQAAIH